MKKAAILIVITGMFIWAVYDLVFSDKPAEEEQADVEVGLEVGKQAPDFELKTLEGGKTTRLSDYRGERVMLNFWATWCPPCRAEMPDMQKFYEEKDVNILAVNLTSTESSAQDVPEFVDDFGLTFPVLLDEDNEVATQYQLQPIPTSFMIDSNGIIQYVAYGAMNYEMMVQEFEKME
ncbi:redoxin domain-containing protein [Salinibacillus xinjiangensis]|uniref:Redoxin domain-containing protein n=1 Tax=Salinibacillus xinjiangensis TaxID=1229268 RepID=A0A6G1X928_9BACI|nr:redoxin domain-containing protein [Salinibacillus xinjiangensis]MRG87474.1 redoxin domain-containing protein [Salinibacillus xinjiangensis]